MRKRGGKTGDSIDEKPPQLDEETRRKTERCARLPSPGGYTEEKLRDPCIGEKPPNPLGN